MPVALGWIKQLGVLVISKHPTALGFSGSGSMLAGVAAPLIGSITEDGIGVTAPVVAFTKTPAIPPWKFRTAGSGSKAVARTMTAQK
jgi:hypothetical protein